MALTLTLWMSFGTLVAEAFAADPAGETGPIHLSRASDSAIMWHRETSPSLDSKLLARLNAAMEADGATQLRASPAALAVLADQPDLGPGSAFCLGRMRLAAGDTAGAESSWAEAERIESNWSWPAQRERIQLRLARGDSAGASVLAWSRFQWEPPPYLSSAKRQRMLWWVRIPAPEGQRGWPESTILGWMREDPWVDGLQLADEIMARRRVAGQRLTAEEHASLGAVYEAHGNHALAGYHLSRSLGWYRDEIQGQWFEVALRAAQAFRSAGRWSDARRVLLQTVVHPCDSSEVARRNLERALIERDAGQWREALRLFAVAIDGPVPDRSQLFLERGVGWMQRGNADEAFEDFEASWEEGLLTGMATGMPEVSFEIARFALSRGDRDMELARRWFARAGRAARGTSWFNPIALDVYRELLRFVDPDSAARVPVSTFVHVFETRAYVGEAAPPMTPMPSLVDDPPSGETRFGRQLIALGMVAEARELIESFDSVNPWRGARREDLAFAQLAYECADHRAGIDLSLDASILLSSPSRRLRIEANEWTRYALIDVAPWEIVPWAYPPVADSVIEFAAGMAGVRPSLLKALVWESSRFDPGTVSKSGGHGLLPEDGERVRPGTPAPALESDPSLMRGAQRLGRFVRRYDGSETAAVLAYFAGDATARRWWHATRKSRSLLPEHLHTALIASGGQEGLSHVHSVLRARLAYARLRPRWAERSSTEAVGP
jgi:tetratricopeptide (TPR) repeat protein